MKKIYFITALLFIAANVLAQDDCEQLRSKEIKRIEDYPGNNDKTEIIRKLKEETLFFIFDDTYKQIYGFTTSLSECQKDINDQYQGMGGVLIRSGNISLRCIECDGNGQSSTNTVASSFNTGSINPNNSTDAATQQMFQRVDNFTSATQRAISEGQAAKEVVKNQDVLQQRAINYNVNTHLAGTPTMAPDLVDMPNENTSSSPGLRTGNSDGQGAGSKKTLSGDAVRTLLGVEKAASDLNSNSGAGAVPQIWEGGVNKNNSIVLTIPEGAIVPVQKQQDSKKNDANKTLTDQSKKTNAASPASPQLPVTVLSPAKPFEKPSEERGEAAGSTINKGGPTK